MHQPRQRLTCRDCLLQRLDRQPRPLRQDQSAARV